VKRIGVFICWCGSNIAATVDVEKVVAAARKLPGVVMATDYKYMCSEVGQALIQEKIREEKLDRVVIGACSPRMHEATFQKTIAKEGLNPYYLEIANLREQCSWVHKDIDKATEKAIAIIRTAVAKVRLNFALKASELDVNHSALVIGGGIAGMQAALDIADAGYKVDLVEKEPSIGGHMAQLDKTFPTLDCSACILTPKMVEVAQHENITLYTYSQVENVDGYVGNFKVTIRQKARSVDMSKCTGCGECWSHCPKKVPSEFDRGLSERRAIYVPFPQAVPNVPVIDRDNCRYFQEGKCKACEKRCPAGAIDYEQEDQLLEKEYGAIVVATGYELLNLDEFGEYGYGKYKDVITSLDFERLINSSGPTGGHLQRPSDGKEPKRVAFISCVGSRDKNRGKNYCSKVCCMYNAKHAILLKEKIPGSQAYVFYIDIRTAGKGYEEFQRRACEEYGAVYLRGNVARVYEEGDGLIVRGVDTLSNEPVELKVDMVVLAAAITPQPDALQVARMLGINTDENSFFTEAHPKLRPVETQMAGIFLAGACQGSKDIPETVAQAGGAASKAVALLGKQVLYSNPMISQVDENLCSGCLYCEEVCPYSAITAKVIEERRGKEIIERTVASVNEALCQGCGNCTVACRSGAINLKGFTNEQILSEVDAICL